MHNEAKPGPSLRGALLWRIWLTSNLQGQVHTWHSNPPRREPFLIALPTRLSVGLEAPMTSSPSPSQFSLAQSWAHSGAPGRLINSHPHCGLLVLGQRAAGNSSVPQNWLESDGRCKSPLSPESGPWGAWGAPAALLALNLDQQQQGRGMVPVSFSSPQGDTDEIQISRAPWGLVKRD